VPPQLAHRSLDYLPGANLLGATAEKLYSSDLVSSFQIFHSGKVRFGNAIRSPHRENLPCLPRSAGISPRGLMLVISNR